MNIFTVIERRIIERRGNERFEGVPYPDRSTGAVHIELTPAWYLNSLPGVPNWGMPSVVRMPVTPRPMTPDYAVLYQRSAQYLMRLTAIAAEICALHASYQAPANQDAVAALAEGKEYSVPSSGNLESRARDLDEEAKALVAALPRVAHAATEQARKDTATMQATAEQAYHAADAAHAAVERKVGEKRAALEEAYRRGLMECEAMQVDSRRELLESGWDYAWTLGLPNTVTGDIDMAQGEALLTTARASYVADAAPTPAPSAEETEAEIAAEEARRAYRIGNGLDTPDDHMPRSPKKSR